MSKTKFSRQTKSFIVLFGIAVVGSYLCIMMWWLLYANTQTNSDNLINYDAPDNSPITKVAEQIAFPQPAPLPVLDTSNWLTYSDKQYNFSFLYEPGWKVLPPKTQGAFTVVQIDPGPTHYDFSIYISPKQFYILSGLPSTTETINGKTALNSNNLVYGINTNNWYFTFDAGQSMGLLPDFNALVHSVKFE